MAEHSGDGGDGGLAMETGGYHDRWNPDILAAIPPDAGRVLELGCGAGALAAQFRRRNPAVEWFGYEVDAGAAARAEERGVRVVRADLDAAPMGYYSDGVPGCDVLVMGDVLEHLRDPWKVLGQRLMWLKPGGLVIACVPNIGHYSNVLRILEGRWQYEDEGLRDRTHLRWFDIASIKDLCRGAGLDVFEVRGRQCCFDQREWDVFKLWVRGVDEPADAKFTQQSRVYQWVVRATKPKIAGSPTPGPAPLRIHASIGEDCCARVRIREPFEALGTIPGVRCTSGDRSDGVECEIVIQQRYRCHPDALIAINRRHVEAGRLIVAEWDDHPGLVPGIVDGSEADGFASIRAAHAVQVSTEALADVVRPHNPHVFVVPNQLAEVPPLRPARDGKGTVLFFGAQNREADWKPIMPAMLRVLAQCRDVSVVVVHDRLFADALREAGVPVQFRPFCPYAEYRRALRGCDIALLPLEDTPLNRCKSDLKFLECAAEGVVCLMSEFAADRISPHANDAYRCYSDAARFEQALSGLITDADGRRRTIDAAYCHVSGHRMLGHHFRRTHAVYLDLLARKADLTAALLERVPGLGQAAASSSKMMVGSTSD